MSNIKPIPGRPPLTQSSLLVGHKGSSRDLSEGVALSFPLISLRGGKWRYRWRGEEQVINDPSTGFAAPTLEVVIVDASKTLTKTWYKDPYAEGQNKRPDCWSSDGKVPDAGVPEPVNDICLTCPKNAFGSSVTPAGKPAKACQDRRRVVIAPSHDLENDARGGPILLSIPPGSLKNSQGYGDWLDENNLAYYGCVTQLSFDQQVSHPKIEFTYLRALDDDDVRTVLSLRGMEQVKRILNSQMNVDGPDEPEQATAPETTQAPAQAQAQAPAAKPAPKTGIAEAVKKPAAPPPSARPVQTKPTPGARPVTPASNEPEEKASSPVDDAFAKLMNIE